jgi:hypothetical protein
MRSNATTLPEGTSAPTNVVCPPTYPSNVVCPPMYSELFETESSLGTPPSYKSHTSSLENSNSDLLEPVPPSKPTKVKKGKKKITVPSETLQDVKE